MEEHGRHPQNQYDTCRRLGHWSRGCRERRDCAEVGFPSGQVGGTGRAGYLAPLPLEKIRTVRIPVDVEVADEKGTGNDSSALERLVFKTVATALEEAFGFTKLVQTKIDQRRLRG